MKFYLIDDDKNVLNILKIIIRERNLGEICGTAECAKDALEDFSKIKPDIVITDLLMPEMDGITLVKQAQGILPETMFVMLSQVSSKDMIAEAYENNIEFYIQKPINSIEVEAVLRKVISSYNASKTLRLMQKIFNDQFPDTQAQHIHSEIKEKDYVVKLKKILQMIGIMTEKGSRDIITLVTYLVENEGDMEDFTLNQLCKYFSDNPKSMEQRVRRTANIGMINLANLGIEDYSNEIFITYASSLYSFEQVRREMDYIRGKSDKRGNVKIKNFLGALVHICKTGNN